MQQFVIKFNHNDPLAIIWMYNKSHPYAISLVERFTEETEERADLAREVMAKLLEHTRPFDSYREIRLFLYKTARNICSNYCTRREIVKPGVTAMDDDRLSRFDKDYFVAQAEAELRGRLFESLEKLPDKTKEIFKLSYYGKMSNAEIAKHLGIREKTVANNKMRAYQKLRWELRNVKRFGIYLLNLFL
jgi:RNA polymerase sigma-19 factor, ECF subfamily